MLGILSAIIAGAAMSVQGVLNTRLSEKTGLYESNVIVQGTAFLLSLIALYFLGKGNIKEITNINKSQGMVCVIGNEGNGISDEVKAIAQLVTIPMNGFAESLNAAAAATIIMWEMMR